MENLDPYRNSISGPSNLQPVAIPTELSRTNSSVNKQSKLLHGWRVYKKKSYEAGNMVIFSLSSITKFFFSIEKSAPQNVI